MRLFVYIACAFFLVSVPATSHALGFEVSVGAWGQEPSGGIASEGESLDLVEENNYDDETRVIGRLKVELPLVLPNIYLMATPMEFEGVGRKNVSFTFGDQTFAANIDYFSRLQLDHYDIALYYGVPFLETATAGVLNVEVGLNARVFDFSAEFEQSIAGVKESEDFTIPIPMVYIGAQVDPVDWLGLEAEVRGIAYNGNHYYDLIGRVKVKPLELFFIAGGWRHQEVDIEEDDVFVNLEFSGPFVEAGIEF
jgi:outer membrane protein